MKYNFLSKKLNLTWLISFELQLTIIKSFVWLRLFNGKMNNDGEVSLRVCLSEILSSLQKEQIKVNDHGSFSISRKL